MNFIIIIKTRKILKKKNIFYNSLPNYTYEDQIRVRLGRVASCYPAWKYVFIYVPLVKIDDVKVNRISVTVRFGPGENRNGQSNASRGWYCCCIITGYGQLSTPVVAENASSNLQKTCDDRGMRIIRWRYAYMDDVGGITSCENFCFSLRRLISMPLIPWLLNTNELDPCNDCRYML